MKTEKKELCEPTDNIGYCRASAASRCAGTDKHQRQSRVRNTPSKCPGKIPRLPGRRGHKDWVTCLYTAGRQLRPSCARSGSYGTVEAQASEGAHVVCGRLVDFATLRIYQLHTALRPLSPRRRARACRRSRQPRRRLSKHGLRSASGSRARSDERRRRARSDGDRPQGVAAGRPRRACRSA